MVCAQHAGTRLVRRSRTLVVATFLIPWLAAGLRLPSDCRSEEKLGLSSLSAIPPETSLEDELARLVNQDRAQRGLPVLELDESLVRVARDHSWQMAVHSQLSHDLPPLGDLESRLDQAGYPRRTARENLARACNVAQAEAALIRSPGHARNLLAGDVTHIGVGIVRGTEPEEDLYITQIFAKPAMRPVARTFSERFESLVEQLRLEAGLTPAQADPAFRALAECSVGKLEMPFSRDTLEQLASYAKHELQQQGLARISRLVIHIQSLRDVDDLKVPEQLRDARATVFGTGIRETVDSHNTPTILVLSFIGLSD